MSKTIMIMRHGKSDWDATYDTDFQRPLNKRGKRSAKAIGKFIADINSAPEIVFSSNAVRAKSTTEMAVEAGAWNCALEFTMGLYEPSAKQVMDYIRQLDNCYSKAMLVGHETWCSEVLNNLTGAQVKFPTAAVAIVDIEVDGWQQTFNNSGRLILFMPPRPLLK